MTEVLAVANWLMPLIYLALVIDYGATFFLRLEPRRRDSWILPVIAFHAAFLTLWGISRQHPPVTTTGEILSLIALSSAVLYRVTESASGDRRAGVFAMLFTFLLQYSSSMLLAAPGGMVSADQPAQRPWAWTHVVLSVFAYTAMVFAAVYGGLHVVGRRRLRQHRFGLLFDRLPPLEVLARMSWYCLLGGFVLMTASLASGALVFSRVRAAGPSPAMAPKIVSYVIMGTTAWLLCGAVVLGKAVRRWSDLRVSVMAVCSFVILAAMFAGSLILR